MEELVAEGIDPKDATEVEDDSLLDETKEIPETGYLDEKGEMRRPWCPETRVLEHRESVCSLSDYAHNNSCFGMQ